MNQAVIDIGSNSMRLTVYNIDGSDFDILFRDKVIAGLAGYVEQGSLSKGGIDRAVSALGHFRDVIDNLSIENVCVFATASLRNINNTEEAVEEISARSGFEIDVISGEEEALLGYQGSMRECHMDSGVFVDVGGASTEAVIFADGAMISSKSYEVGSLKLYKECVSKLVPGKEGIARIREAVNGAFGKKSFRGKGMPDSMICIGGTARAIMKTACYLYDLPADTREITKSQFYEVGRKLLSSQEEAAALILRIAPERIHTMIPGYLILREIADRIEPEIFAVGRCGVREGYLCRKILK